MRTGGLTLEFYGRNRKQEDLDAGTSPFTVLSTIESIVQRFTEQLTVYT